MGIMENDGDAYPSSPKAEFNYIQKSRISIVKVYSNLILASKHFAHQKLKFESNNFKSRGDFALLDNFDTYL